MIFSNPHYRLTDTELVNDVHSKLNATILHKRVEVRDEEEVKAGLAYARKSGKPICISGCRHAMGGQPFRGGAIMLDTRSMNRVLAFDRKKGSIEVQAGITWPDIVAYLRQIQPSHDPAWSIAQKQTGCDQLMIGGAISANIHGRGLRMKPFVADIESFRMVLADGKSIDCNRQHNEHLFRLAVGGYGLFGVITSVRIRLIPRRLLRRRVEITSSISLYNHFQYSIVNGAVYGDFQFAIDSSSPDFLHRGICSTYSPVDASHADLAQNSVLSMDDWRELLVLAHTDKKRAFHKYSEHYLHTDGQLYWSDIFQLSTYLNHYHSELDEQVGAALRGSEIITELYVPQAAISRFLALSAELLLEHDANVIYGTVRLIEADDETFLPWARSRYACVVLNLHTDHSCQSLSSVADTFRALIDLAASMGGSFYLTYHRYAREDQVLRCYPQFASFLREKAHYDPEELFQSDWYLHYRHLRQQN